VPVQEGSNEIPAARQLLGKVSVTDKRLVYAATQVEIGNKSFEGGAIMRDSRPPEELVAMATL
jgi:hypothetical protein